MNTVGKGSNGREIDGIIVEVIGGKIVRRKFVGIVGRNMVSESSIAGEFFGGNRVGFSVEDIVKGNEKNAES